MTKAQHQAREYAAETPRTVRVRIAVAVDAEGHWAAYAWGTGERLGQSVAEMLGCVAEMMGDHDGVEHWVEHWIEADIPLPGQQTIRGEVVP